MERKTIWIGNKAINVKVAKNIFEKAKGLMFEKKERAMPMIFPSKKKMRMAVHTWFMRFPIDIYFFDEQGKVVEVVRELKPWRYYRTKKKVAGFLEVPIHLRENINIKENIKIENLWNN